jgi:hypothetical protein
LPNSPNFAGGASNGRWNNRPGLVLGRNCCLILKMIKMSPMLIKKLDTCTESIHAKRKSGDGRGVGKIYTEP